MALFDEQLTGTSLKLQLFAVSERQLRQQSSLMIYAQAREMLQMEPTALSEDDNGMARTSPSKSDIPGNIENRRWYRRLVEIFLGYIFPKKKTLISCTCIVDYSLVFISEASTTAVTTPEGYQDRNSLLEQYLRRLSV